MLEEQLISAGLFGSQAEVMIYLLASGPRKAREVALGVGRPRGVAYKALDELVEMGLVRKVEKSGAVAIFQAEHPSKLEELFEAKMKKVEQERKRFSALMPDLTSLYNLSFNKPGVRYFEGLEGVREVAFDTLTAKEEIYTYSNIEAVMKYLRGLNEEYVKRRDKLDILKRVIAVDSPGAREIFQDYHRKTTITRFIDHKKYPFADAVVQIYDGRVSFISVSDEAMLGMIIYDQNIYKMNKTMFEFIWDHAKTWSDLFESDVDSII